MNILVAIVLGFALGILCCILIYILHSAFGEYIDNAIEKMRRGSDNNEQH